MALQQSLFGLGYQITKEMSKRLRDAEQFSVQGYLRDLVDKIPDGHAMLGELSDASLRMPRQSSDGRQLTWHKTVMIISSKIVNQPTCDMDCWYVAANHAGSRNPSDRRDHIVKFSAQGSKNKWITARVLYVLLHPDAFDDITDRSLTKKLVLHRCGKGKASEPNGPVCINPLHLKLSDQKQNRHDERCGHSCRALMPT